MKYRAEVDGLRALAVLPVVLFHAGFEYFSGGFVGVDIFFVISGYLITTIVITEIHEKKFSIVQFYERRARRILPALYFVMAISIPIAYLVLVPYHFKNFGQSLVATATFSSNILFFLETGYFQPNSELKPMLHTWSLSVEEQFYIFFPSLMMLLWALGIKKLTLVILSAGLASFAYANWGSINSPNATFFLIFSRLWELFIGVVVALILFRRDLKVSLFVKQVLSLTGVLAILISVRLFDEFTPFPGYYALLPTLGAGLIIVFARPGTLTHRILSSSPLVGLGLISYSAYLWHQPLFAFARHLSVDEPTQSVFLVLIAFTFCVAWFSWRFIEAPFRDREYFSKGAIFKLSLTGVTVFCGVGLLIHFQDGVEMRLDSREMSIYKFLKYDRLSVYREGTCFATDNSESVTDPVCFDGGNLIWGDSHAAALSHGLRAQGHFAQLTKASCAPLLSRSVSCVRFNDEVMLAVKSGNYKYIYLHANWSNYREAEIQSLKSTIGELRRASPGSNIVVVGGLPQWHPSLPEMVLKVDRKDSSGLDDLFLKNFSLPEVIYNDVLVKRVVEFAETDLVSFVSLVDLLCDGAECLANLSKCGEFEPLVWDYGHLTAAGSIATAGLIFGKPAVGESCLVK